MRYTIKQLIPDKVKEKDAYAAKIKGKFFIFDKESLEEYKKFNNELFRIVIENGYLARILKTLSEDNKICFFHEWLMREDVEKFRDNNKEWKKGIVHIHHLTFCKGVNIKKYLKVMMGDKHYSLHGTIHLGDIEESDLEDTPIIKL